MAEQTKPSITPQAQAADKVAVPLEMATKSGSIRVQKDGDVITIDLDPIICQEIGSYHRCKVRVKFQEGQQQVSILPTAPL